MTSQISSLTSAVYKSRGILLEQMLGQGFDISEYSGFSVNEVNTMKTNNQLDMMLEKNDEDHDAKALRPANLQEMLDDLFSVEEILKKTDTLLIVVKDEVNETLINTLKHIWEQDKIFIIIQSLRRLQFNLLNHVFVPPHRILSMSETIQIRSRYNIMSDGQFPDISRFDPVAQAIGIRPGQVCEIIRPSKTAISAPYYRICM